MHVTCLFSSALCELFVLHSRDVTIAADRHLFVYCGEESQFAMSVAVHCRPRLLFLHFVFRLSCNPSGGLTELVVVGCLFVCLFVVVTFVCLLRVS